MSETFAYDGLNRLTSATVHATPCGDSALNLMKDLRPAWSSASHHGTVEIELSALDRNLIIFAVRNLVGITAGGRNVDDDGDAGRQWHVPDVEAVDVRIDVLL